MKLKAFLFSALAGSVVLVAIDGLWYSVLMENFYAANTAQPDCMRAEPDTMGIVAGQIIFAFVMAYLLNYWRERTPSAIKGFMLGAAIGVILYPALDLMLHSQIYLITKKAMLVDIIYGIPAYGIVGMVVGWVSSLFSSKEV